MGAEANANPNEIDSSAVPPELDPPAQLPRSVIPRGRTPGNGPGGPAWPGRSGLACLPGCPRLTDPSRLALLVPGDRPLTLSAFCSAGHELQDSGLRLVAGVDHTVRIRDPTKGRVRRAAEREEQRGERHVVLTQIGGEQAQRTKRQHGRKYRTQGGRSRTAS